MDNFVEREITDRFKSGRQDVHDLIAPLIELTQKSSSLVVGYGAPQAGVRSEMIPYFHVCGTPTENEPLRVLVIGGWVGTEIVTPYAIACLLVALESRLRLAAGIEITAYPVANLRRIAKLCFLSRRSKSMACAAGKIHNSAMFGCLSGNSSATLTTQFSSCGKTRGLWTRTLKPGLPKKLKRLFSPMR